MSKTKPSNNKLAIGVIVLIIVLILMIKFVNYVQLNFEMHYDKDPYIDTVFADDFTFAKFDMIQDGMSPEEVIALIGEPFDKDLTGSATHKVDRNSLEIPPPDFEQDCWGYSHDGKLGDKGDTSWYSYVICFRDERVESTIVNEFFD